MGKIVKYCAACDESFAEKFTFCPDCGKEMTAFEMNPLAIDEKTAIENAVHNHADTEAFSFDASENIETSPIKEPALVSGATLISNDIQTEAFSENSADDFELDFSDDDEAEDIVEPKTIDEVEKVETFVPAASAANGNGDHSSANYNYQTVSNYPANDGYHVAIIEEKNVKQRNLLLLGAFLVMMTLSVGGVIYSIFNSPLFIAAIGDESGLYALIPEIDPVPMEVEDPPKKNEDKGGGGGGGGRDEQTPTSKGRLATQTEKPIIAPDVSIIQRKAELQQPVASTQGNVQRQSTLDRYGDPNSKYDALSNGKGSGGGQGSGVGTGQGSGRGTGQGSGLGSGSGSGIGDGTGDGKGGGGGRDANQPPPPPKEPVGVTEGLKILAKPKANYTDAARTNQVQGVVRLRVTFSASGAIAGITPVSGLPYGLTEQAIAAARQIRFEPAKRNGVAQSATKILEYSFTIY